MTTLIIITVVGLLTGLAIAIVSYFFATPANPLQDQVLELLPGANCGGCGFAGCGGYAEALAQGKAKPGLCSAQSTANLQKLTALLGTTAEKKEPMVAVVLCSGDNSHASRRAQYNGINDCRDASQVAGGAKSCNYGCLGMGSCARACPFGAIEITEHGIALVHRELCRGCGSCVAVCPKKLIRLVPKSASLHVFCSSPLKGILKRNACSVACIGCGKCFRAAPDNIIMEPGKFLAQVNYDNPPPEELACQCPTGALRSKKRFMEG